MPKYINGDGDVLPVKTPYTRCPMKGYQRCPHTCNDGRCVSGDGIPIWRREGGSLRRHAQSKRMHPTCSSVCRAFCVITDGADALQHLKLYVVPTNDDYLAAIQYPTLPESKRKAILTFLRVNRIYIKVIILIWMKTIFG